MTSFVPSQRSFEVREITTKWCLPLVAAGGKVFNCRVFKVEVVFRDC